MPAKKEAKAAIAALIKANPTWSNDRVWAALKEDGYTLDDKVLISDVRTDLGDKKPSWAKED